MSTPPSQSPSILVTGDIVLDCHLYGGMRTLATSFAEPGSNYSLRPGGAALSCSLLQACPKAWDEAKQKFDKENRGLQAKGEKPSAWPSALPATRPDFQVHLGLDTAKLESSLPGHMRSYGVWTEHPPTEGGKPVWRMTQGFGYGPWAASNPDEVFKRKALESGISPVLTLIDDGGILFRHEAARKAWPDFSADAAGYFLLKMSGPLCRGDLWAALEPVLERLLVVVSVEDLRREDCQINGRLSWEQAVEHTVAALRNDPVAGELLRAAHVIVNFDSEGALCVHRKRDGGHSARLIFRPTELEGHHARKIRGTAYGLQTCLVAGIAHHLMHRHTTPPQGKQPSPFKDAPTLEQAVRDGVTAGLLARRRLLELGHGPVGQSAPGFPEAALGAILIGTHGGYVAASVPIDSLTATDCTWTILQQSEQVAGALAPLTGVAELTARFGLGALSAVPALQLGEVFTVDRSEIESLRTLHALIADYEAVKVQKKPLSIGVFGPPGAGKSFGVKALKEAVFGEKAKFLEFNLSQFKTPDELIGAFHQVRDAVLRGPTPIAFWDEFDSQHYRWLQYLLAPMQDGCFQEGQITHPIGKCVFVFAGGTADTLAEFGVQPPPYLQHGVRMKVSERDYAERLQAEKDYHEFKLLKGPDFISRLHGYLNVLGPNPRTARICVDVTWPIRRALMLRGLLELKPDAELRIDAGLLHALLAVSGYKHGSRSLEKIVVALQLGRHEGRLTRSALPPDPLLERETYAAEFHQLMQQGNAFRNLPDLEALAASIHANFLDAGPKSLLEAERKADPGLAWTIHPSIQREYAKLSPDHKASNRAAARRIPDHLALISFIIQKRTSKDRATWKDSLIAALDRHLERLAQAEHLGWCAERAANGWTYAKDRDDTLKRHPLLVDWSKLGPADRDKDRSSIKAIPELLNNAGFKAVQFTAAPFKSRKPPQRGSPRGSRPSKQHSPARVG
jgi:hypothetical protein